MTALVYPLSAFPVGFYVSALLDEVAASAAGPRLDFIDEKDGGAVCVWGTWQAGDAATVDAVVAAHVPPPVSSFTADLTPAAAALVESDPGLYIAGYWLP